MPTRPIQLSLLACLLTVAAGGCWPGYRPGGQQASYDTYTYISKPDYPLSVKLMDWTTNTTIWTVDVPIGKELVVQFYEDHDPKNATRPALMRWEIFDAGREFGELHNAMPAPDRDHRRLDPFIRTTPAAAPPPEPAAPK